MTTRAALSTLLITLALLSGPTPSHAAGVVGTGNPASCTPTALTQALAGGGTVTFACGPNPHVIVLPQRYTVSADTTIRGGDRIVLSGGTVHGVFTVQTGRTLTLEHLEVRDGGAENWALYVSDSATLELDGVGVGNCVRGGIYNAGGTVTVTDSTFADNDASAAGAAITNEGGGDLTVERSAFLRNLNGAIFAAGPTTITDTLFSENRGDSFGGGAIAHNEELSCIRCRFDDNQAAAGGAIYTSGDLVVEDSVFRRNSTTLFDGGAIALYNQTESPSSVVVRASTFEDNESRRAGGAVRCDAPNGTCTLQNVTFTRNTALLAGSASELSVKNGAVQVSHATVLAGGTPAIERVAGTLALRNSIVVGGSCTGGLTDGGGNLQFEPGSCAASFKSGDPALFQLADNGGFTPTHELGTGSAARGIAAANCLPTDQRGVARPQTACDAGAFQRGALPKLTALWPNRTEAGGPEFMMAVQGASFMQPTTRVLWNGQPLQIVSWSTTELHVIVPAALIAHVGVATVTVENPNPPVPDGGVSATNLPFTIEDVTPPPTDPEDPEDPEDPTDPVGPCDGLTGYDAVLCALDVAQTPGHFCAAADLDPKLDGALQKALDKAAGMVASAENASAKKQGRFLKKARVQLEKLGRKAASKKAGSTTPDCKTNIIDGMSLLATDVAGLGA